MSIYCSICFLSYGTEDIVVSINRCGHIYHQNCLETWKKSSNQTSCPICRITYTKRSLTKLYFNVEEPEYNVQLNNDLKKQKLFSENLQKSYEKLEEEIKQRNREIENMKQSWCTMKQELNTTKTEYGIKCQAYNIIDTVNNEYLQCNMKYQSENERLRSESIKLKHEVELLKKKLLQPKLSEKFVDLTNDDDDEIEIIECSKKSEIIEIDDDENEIQVLENEKVYKENEISNEIQIPNDKDDDKLNKSPIKSYLNEEDDYKILEDFIMSQI